MTDNHSQQKTAPHLTHYLVATAALIVIFAGLRTVAPILIPFLLSVFIAIMCLSPLHWLQQHKVPTALAVLIVITALILILLLLGVFVGTSLTDFTRSLPQYQERLDSLMGAALMGLGKLGLDTSSFNMKDVVNPAAAMHLANSLLGGLSQVLSNTFLIILTVVFILLEASSFPVKARAMLGAAHTLEHFDTFIQSVNSYVGIKAVVSLATGFTVAIALAIIGVDYPILWGFLAFLLNFVPNIGSIIAAVPAVLLALIQLGVGSALATGMVYLVVNLVVGSIIEPRLLGKGIGLSALVVFLSLIFWGWMLGPVGMLLSVPLTITVKIALESNEQTRWAAIWLGSADAATEQTTRD
ncbi:MAG: AI-2E family transporter [Gammaproteobacteria bacterium]|nr:AI-2E family transporter [Gammaproteobacteria bacterium]